MRDRFAAIYTAALADILDERGYHDQTLPPSIRALEAGTRVAGPAYTVKGGPATNPDAASYDEAIRKVLAMLGDVPAGHVAVYACGQDVSAHLGELSVTSLNARGVAGCVLDGGCRDVAFIRDEGFPVFTRFVTPADSTWRWELEATQVPVTIGSVRIEPGDWIVGDDDGVVVVPHAIASVVLAKAEQKAATENEIRVAVRGGTPPLEAYERYGTF
jgi:4-hydroxy-4-methyl-2-oxoglutarate aldolase